MSETVEEQHVSEEQKDEHDPEQIRQEICDKIRKHLKKNQMKKLRTYLDDLYFAEIADVMNFGLSPEDSVQCFQLLDINQAAEVLAGLDPELQERCLASQEALKASKILREMPADDAVDILQEIERDLGRKLIDEMPLDEDTRMLQMLLLEEPDTAAGIMSTDFIEIPINATVGEALKIIKKSEEKDFIYYSYLVDEDEKLAGVVSLKNLITAASTKPLAEVATTDVKSILINYDQEFVANLFRKYYKLLAMPVVDSDNYVQGIITLDDIVDVIDEETTEDIYKATGISIEEVDEKNLLTGPAINAVKARIPWLSITVFGHLIAATIIASYKDTVAAAVIAVSFMPLLTGLSGNMGTQSDTIAVRGLSQQLITENNFTEKLFREFRVALITGSIFSVFVGITCYAFYRHIELSLLLSGWIIISTCISSCLGISIPYIYQKYFRNDPAGVGGPFLTTMSDILTFVIYLYFVTLFLDRMI